MTRHPAIWIVLASVVMAASWALFIDRSGDETVSEYDAVSPPTAPVPPETRARPGPTIETTTEAHGGPGFTVAVYDALTESPIEAATVQPDESASATFTDAEGLARLSGPLPEVLRVSAAGYATRVVDPDNEQLDSVASPFCFIELVPGREVTGVVLDPDGSAVTEGWVYCIAEVCDSRRFMDLGPLGQEQKHYYHDDPIRVPIGADGSFVWTTGSRRIAFQAMVPGYAPTFTDILELDEHSSREFHVVVRRGSEFRGRFVDEDGNPVVGARLTPAYDPGLREPDRLFAALDGNRLVGYYGTDETITDDSGEFRLRGVPGPSLRLEWQHDEYVPRELPWFDVAESPANVVVSAARRLSMTLPQVPQGSDVFIDVGNRGTSTELRREAGRFRSRGIDASSSFGTLKVQGFLPQPIQWPAGRGDHDLGELSLDEGETVTVIVRDPEGRPVSGASVSFGKEHAYGWEVVETNREGVASLAGFLPSRARLYARAQGYRTGSAAVDVPLSQPVEITLTRAATVRARVVHHDGRPAVGGELIVFRIEQGERGSYVSAADIGLDGFALTSAVQPGDVYEFTAMDGALSVSSERIEIESGVVYDLGTLTLPQPSSISGIVRSAAGAPVPLAKLDFHPEDGASPMVGYSRADASGYFENRALPAGRYKVVARSSGSLPGEAHVLLPPGAHREVDVTLAAARPLSGRVLYDDGTPAVGVEVSVEPQGESVFYGGEAVTDESGFWEIRDFPASVPEDEPVDVHAGTGLFAYGEFYETFPSVAQIPSLITIARGGSVRVEFSVPEGVSPERDVEVFLELADDGDERSTTLEEGAFFANLPPGEAEVSVHVMGCRAMDAVTCRIEAGSETSLSFRPVPLPPREEAVVLVVDASGEPLPKARVSVSFDYDGTTHLIADENGECPLLLGEHYEDILCVRKSGFGSVAVRHPYTQLRDGVLVVTLHPECVVRVLVDRAGVDDDFDLGLMRSRSPYSFGIPPPRTEGSETIWRGLSPDTYEIDGEIGKEDIDPVLVTLSPGEERLVSIEAPWTFEVTGRVLTNGTPVTRGYIRSACPTARDYRDTQVDERGEYRLTLRHVGMYQVTYSRGNIESTRRLRIDGPRRVDFEIQTVRANFHVLDADGKPVTHREFSIIGPASAGTRLDENGRASFPDLAPGDYLWRMESRAVHGYSRGRIPLLADGAHVIQLEAARAITIRPDRKSHSHWRIELLDEWGHWTELDSYVRGETTVGVPPPTRVLEVYDEHGGARILLDDAHDTYDVATTPGGLLWISTTPSAAITCHPIDTDGNPIPDAAPITKRAGYTGNSRLGLPPGIYRVESESLQGESRSTTVSVTEGETTRADLED